MRWVLAVLAALALPLQAAEAPPPLQVYISTGWGPPFVLHDEAQDEPAAPLRGLIPDWYAALSAELGRPIELRLRPTRRQKATPPNSDIRCFGVEEWEPPQVRRAFKNLPPFMAVEEVLVSLRDQARVRDLADLQGHVIGTVAGYHYPALTRAFDTGQALRDDAPDELRALMKQLLGRTHYAVVRRSTLEYLRQQEPQRWAPLTASPWVLASVQMSCGVRLGGPLALEELARAQSAVLAQAAWQQRLAGALLPEAYLTAAPPGAGSARPKARPRP
jgi:hypothetical protein